MGMRSIFISQHIRYLCQPTLMWLSMASLALIPSQQAIAYKSSMEYYHHNHQGSLLEVYDGATNKRLLSQAWSPWGERQILHTVTSGDQPSAGNLLAQGLPAHMGYTGHKQLLATGLTFAGDTRLYDARLKRFLNSDDRTTGGIRGQNRYSYAYNNPMIYIDPDGRAPTKDPRYRTDALFRWEQRADIMKKLRQATKLLSKAEIILKSYANGSGADNLLNAQPQLFLSLKLKQTTCNFWNEIRTLLIEDLTRKAIAAEKKVCFHNFIRNAYPSLLLRRYRYLVDNGFFTRAFDIYNELRSTSPVEMPSVFYEEIAPNVVKLIESGNTNRIESVMHRAWLEYDQSARKVNDYSQRLNAYFTSINNPHNTITDLHLHGLEYVNKVRYRLIDKAFVHAATFHTLQWISPQEYNNFLTSGSYQSQQYQKYGFLIIDFSADFSGLQFGLGAKR